MIDFSNSSLSEESKKRVREYVLDQGDLFALDDTELGCTHLVTHEIETGDSPPIKQHARREPYSQRAKITLLIKEMLDRGVIVPSSSPWASPIVLVRKPDGSPRLCVDYRRLNFVTEKDVFPLPRIADLSDRLGEAGVYSTLDLASGYWQIAMGKKSQPKTAFATYDGLYEFTKMPFGLTNAPATFQRVMQLVVAGLDGFCSVYLDDIVVFSRDINEHLEHLGQIFERLRQAGFKLRPKKCFFAKKEVRYLGHVISASGIATDGGKTRAVKEFPVPKNVKDLRSFLGLASYYRRFMQNFSRIAEPLYTLLRKGVEFE